MRGYCRICQLAPEPDEETKLLDRRRFCLGCRIAYDRGRREALAEVLEAAARLRDRSRENVANEDEAESAMAIGGGAASRAIVGFVRRAARRGTPRRLRP